MQLAYRLMAQKYNFLYSQQYIYSFFITELLHPTTAHKQIYIICFPSINISRINSPIYHQYKQDFPLFTFITVRSRDVSKSRFITMLYGIKFNNSCSLFIASYISSLPEIMQYFNVNNKR